ncbi:MAG: helix-turn-helix domain-containing protein [Nostoc sp. RI_552]|nr:helix-turn-helix domain-containing protein [Nostoc sp. RI_552]
MTTPIASCSYWRNQRKGTDALLAQNQSACSIATRQELSQRLGRNESTVYRWVKRYHQEGIEALLELKTPPGKQSLVPPQVMNQLQQDLSQPQGFNSYSQIQE